MTKHARDMSTEEAAAALAELKRPKPDPMPIDKTAREMSEAERKEWLRAHKQRHSG
jgi:ribosomal protein L29